MFWIVYIIISVILIFLISVLIKNLFLKITFLSFFSALFLGVWFISPGSTEIAPIFSIFILEVSILESNGLQRIFRPFFAIFLFTLICSSAYYIYKKTRS